MNKLFLALIALLIGILFPLIGFFAGLMPLYHQGQNWWNSLTYVTASAQIESLTRVEHLTRKKVLTYKTDATFRYTFEGRQYVGGQASFYSLAERPGGFQDNLYARLKEVRQRQSAVDVWLDRRHPERAVFDRTLIWDEALFGLPFAVVFNGFGIGAWVLIFRLWQRGRNKTISDRLQQGQPVLIKATNGIPLLVFFTLAWNVLSWSFAGIALGEVRAHGFSVAVIAFLFPAAGVALILLTGQQLRNGWLAGRPLLEVTGLSPLRGYIHFRPAIGQRSPPLELMQHITISLRILKNAMGGKKPLKSWEHCLRDGAVARGTATLSFEVDPPRERLQEQLEFELELAGANFTFLLPRSR